ncbi:MAG: hypothetical protein ABSA96_12210 [Candidatus Acidiferrales bacterium]|jgi:hypothetical protein
MDDPLNIPEELPFEHAQPSEGAEGTAGVDAQDLGSIGQQFTGSGAEPVGKPVAEGAPTVETASAAILVASPRGNGRDDAEFRRRKFRHNLFLLLSLSLGAFVLTTWIFVRLDSPFGIFSTGPQEIVRAQLRALDRGQLRPAYDMFSARYRGQVSYDDWHKLIVTHWRMFHAEVLRSGTLAQDGPGVSLEIYLHGADDKDYRARFTLVRAGGRWWIDDVHWTEEDGERDLVRS